MTRSVFGLIALAAAFAGSCGAKTGLRTPELEPEEQPPPCVEIPVDAKGAVVELATQVQLRRGDVFFLIDHSESMTAEIDEIRARLRNELAPAIFEEIPDTEFGVAVFSDFPVIAEEANGRLTPFGDPELDKPFELLLPMTGELSQVQGALNAIDLVPGGDPPESQLEALYQLMTGEGLGDCADPTADGCFVPPSSGCPRGGFGAACFRSDALPVVLLFTDAEFHNGPNPPSDSLLVKDYGSFPTATPHSYEETVQVLGDNDARVVGLWSGQADATRDDMESLLRDTGSVDAAGEPLLFDIGSEGQDLGTSVIDAVKEFADAVVFDIDTVLVDPEPADGVEVTDFVEAVRPLSADPPEGVEAIDEEAGVFRGVAAGTSVVFEVELSSGVVAPGAGPQVYALTLQFRGDGRTFLGSQQVNLVIPGADGAGCEALGFESFSN